MNEVCRTCLSESKEADFMNIVGKIIGNKTVLDFINTFAPVTLLSNDPLPKVVCSSCLEKIYLIYTFCQEILNADNILKKKLSVTTYEDISVKTIGSNTLRNGTQYKLCTKSLSSNANKTNFIIKEEDILNDDTTNSMVNTGNLSKCKIKNSTKCNYKPRIEQTKPVVKHKSKKRIYECKECNKLFKKADHYKVHMTTHTGEKKYACEFCPKRFARSYVLVYHRRVHTGERPYTCSICSKRFSTPSNFYTHKKIHTGEKNYKCEFCDESFIQSDSLKIHIRRIHTGERPFLCEICSSAFRSNSSLLTHKLDMHGEKQACPLCNKLYSSRVLKEHVRRHREKEQGIKRFACDQCGKQFTCSSSRKKHLLIHSGEKPFSCEICGKSFNQRSALKTHMRVHSDFMPFQCEYCTKSFRYKHHLRSHNNTHHKELLQEDNSSE